MRSILTISTDMLSTIQTFVLAHLKNILSPISSWKHSQLLPFRRTGQQSGAGWSRLVKTTKTSYYTRITFSFYGLPTEHKFLNSTLSLLFVPSHKYSTNIPLSIFFLNQRQCIPYLLELNHPH